MISTARYKKSRNLSHLIAKSCPSAHNDCSCLVSTFIAFPKMLFMISYPLLLFGSLWLQSGMLYWMILASPDSFTDVKGELIPIIVGLISTITHFVFWSMYLSASAKASRLGPPSPSEWLTTLRFVSSTLSLSSFDRIPFAGLSVSEASAGATWRMGGCVLHD